MITTAEASKLALANDANTGILQTRPGLANLQVTYGHPGAVADLEVMWIGDVSWSDEEWANVNRTKRDEDFNIDLLIDIRVPDSSQQEATERLIEVMGEVEAALREDVRNPLGVTGVYQVELKPRAIREGVYSEGRWANLIAAIRVRARK